MTVYVDDIRIPATVGRFTAKWSHLIADTREELHAFADRLGLRRSYFQDPVVNGKPKAVPGTLAAEHWHYDLTESKRQQAIKLGAVPVAWRDLPGIIAARFAALAAADWEPRGELPADTAATIRELTAGPEYDPEPLPDPADYCEQCGKPLARCRAWTEGDHTEADLL